MRKLKKENPFPSFNSSNPTNEGVDNLVGPQTKFKKKEKEKHIMKINHEKHHKFDKTGGLNVRATMESIRKDVEAVLAEVEKELEKVGEEIVNDQEKFAPVVRSVFENHPTVQFTAPHLVSQVLTALETPAQDYTETSRRVARFVKYSPDLIKTRGRSGGVAHVDFPREESEAAE